MQTSLEWILCANRPSPVGSWTNPNIVISQKAQPSLSAPLLVERSCKALYLHKLFTINCNSSVHPTTIPGNIYKGWSLSLKLMLIVSTTLTTGIFTINTLLDTDWTNGIGTATEIYSSYWALVSYWCPISYSHGLGTGCEKTHSSSQAEIHMEIKDIKKMDTRIPLGDVEEFCLCVQPGNKCLSEPQIKDTIVLSWIWQVRLSFEDKFFKLFLKANFLSS